MLGGNVDRRQDIPQHPIIHSWIFVRKLPGEEVQLRQQFRAPGLASPADGFVTMSGEAFVTLLLGARPLLASLQAKGPIFTDQDGRS